MAIDPHLDLVRRIAEAVRERGWTLPYVVDTHTHADHPSGSAALAALFASTRMAHASSGHRGVARHLEDGDVLHLGDVAVRVRHTPGHTPDHVALVADGALFSGDTLHIGGVARADFLGGDARRLHRTLEDLLATLPGSTLLEPGHDYHGRLESTLAEERAGNPWLSLGEAEFVRRLKADPPPPPANLEELLAVNRGEEAIPAVVQAATAVARARRGGAGSVIDVRSGVEYDSEHVPESVHVPLGELAKRVDEVMAAPAPRLLLCRNGSRAASARSVLADLGLGGLSVVEGGLEAYRAAGGATVAGPRRMSLERQVRVAAGLVVVLGAVLGAWVHPAWIALCAAVGAGQVVAGLTDRCGLGRLLAGMPWNATHAASERSAPASCAAASCAAGPLEPPPGTR